MKKLAKNSLVDLHALSGQFSDALGFVECAVIALHDEERVGPALLVLEHAIGELRRVHRNLDRAAAEQLFIRSLAESRRS
jgi:hypothetical protein